MSEGRKRLCLLVAATIAAALLCEGGIRIFDLARGRSTNARAFWYWGYEQDPYLGWRGRPDAAMVTEFDDIRHNRDGFRDGRDMASLFRRSADRRLIVCVGESSTYGVGAGSNEWTYPASLERALRSESGSDRWIVYNAGMPGYTTHEVLELVNLQLLKLQPEIIVEMDLANDHDFMARYLDDTTDYNHLPIRLAQCSRTPARDLLMRSSLFALISTRITWTAGDDLGSMRVSAPRNRPTARGLKLYRDNLAMTALLARRSGVQLLLVDQPIDYAELPASEVESHEALRAALRELSREEGVPLLSAHSTMDWNGLTIREKVHLGRTGYERLARLLAPQILSAAKEVDARSDGAAEGRREGLVQK